MKNHKDRVLKCRLIARCVVDLIALIIATDSR
jgi:hypothetical protein